MKSRRFIRESLLEAQSCARMQFQAEIGSLLHGDASKHKQSQAKVYRGIFSQWRQGHAAALRPASVAAFRPTRAVNPAFFVAFFYFP